MSHRTRRGSRNGRKRRRHWLATLERLRRSPGYNMASVLDWRHSRMSDEQRERSQEAMASFADSMLKESEGWPKNDVDLPMELWAPLFRMIDQPFEFTETQELFLRKP